MTRAIVLLAIILSSLVCNRPATAQDESLTIDADPMPRDVAVELKADHLVSSILPGRPAHHKYMVEQFSRRGPYRQRVDVTLVDSGLNIRGAHSEVLIATMWIQALTDPNVRPADPASDMFPEEVPTVESVVKRIHEEQAKESSDVEVLSSLRRDLQLLVKGRFIARLETQEEQLARAQRDLDTARKQLARRRDLQLEIIERRVEELQYDFDLSWVQKDEAVNQKHPEDIPPRRQTVQPGTSQSLVRPVVRYPETPEQVVRDMYGCLREEDWVAYIQLLTDDQVELLCRTQIHSTALATVHLQRYGGDQESQEAVQAMIADVDASIHGKPHPSDIQEWKTHFSEILTRMAANSGIDPASFDLEAWARKGATRVRKPRRFLARMLPLSTAAIQTDYVPPNESQLAISVVVQGDRAVAMISRGLESSSSPRTLWLRLIDGRWLISRLAAENHVPSNWAMERGDDVLTYRDETESPETDLATEPGQQRETPSPDIPHADTPERVVRRLLAYQEQKDFAGYAGLLPDEIIAVLNQFLVKSAAMLSLSIQLGATAKTSKDLLLSENMITEFESSMSGVPDPERVKVFEAEFKEMVHALTAKNVAVSGPVNTKLLARRAAQTVTNPRVFFAKMMALMSQTTGVDALDGPAHNSDMSVVIDGNHATVSVPGRDSDNSELRIQLQRVDGRWEITRLFPEEAIQALGKPTTKE